MKNKRKIRIVPEKRTRKKTKRMRRRKIKKLDKEDLSASSNGDSETKPWQKLIKEVMNDRNSCWEEQVTIHKYQGKSKERTESETFNGLLLASRKRLRYVSMLLKRIQYAETLSKPKRKFMEEEDMDFEDTTEAAINKLKSVYSTSVAVNVHYYYSRKSFPCNNGNTSFPAALTE